VVYCSISGIIDFRPLNYPKNNAHPRCNGHKLHKSLKFSDIYGQDENERWGDILPSKQDSTICVVVLMWFKFTLHTPLTRLSRLNIVYVYYFCQRGNVCALSLLKRAKKVKESAWWPKTLSDLPAAPASSFVITQKNKYSSCGAN